MGDFARHFGARLRAARQRKGWTQATLAEAAEVGANYVPRLERGELTPSVEAAWRLSRALGASLDALCADASDTAEPGAPTLDAVRSLDDDDVALLRHAVDLVVRMRGSRRDPASGVTRVRTAARTEVAPAPTELTPADAETGGAKANS